MRTLLIVIAAILSCACNAADPVRFTITGNLDLHRDDSLRLVRTDRSVVAACPVSGNGDFTISGQADLPGLFFIEARGSRLDIPVYIDGGDFKMEGSRWDYIVRGPSGSLQEEYAEYIIERKALHAQQAELARDGGNVATEMTMDSLNAMIDSQFMRALERFNDTEISPYIAHSNLYMLEVKFRLFQNTVDLLGRNSVVSPLTEEVMAKFRAKQESRLSGTAPEFELPDMDGNVIALSSLRGQWVLLDFWASWCAPCRKNNKELVKYVDLLARHNVAVVSLSLDDNDQAWRRAIAQDGVGWLQLIDRNGFDDSTIRKQYKVTGLPTVFLIDPRGDVAVIDPTIDEILSLSPQL